MRRVYKWIAHLIALGVLLQAAFVASAWFQTINDIDGGLTITEDYEGNLGHSLHGTNGFMVMPVVGLIFFIVSFFAKLPGGVKWAGFTFLAIVVQVVLALVAFGAPIVGLLHGINAFLVFGLALYAGRRVAAGVTEHDHVHTGAAATV